MKKFIAPLLAVFALVISACGAKTPALTSSSVLGSGGNFGSVVALSYDRAGGADLAFTVIPTSTLATFYVQITRKNYGAMNVVFPITSTATIYPILLGMFNGSIAISEGLSGPAGVLNFVVTGSVSARNYHYPTLSTATYGSFSTFETYVYNLVGSGSGSGGSHSTYSTY